MRNRVTKVIALTLCFLLLQLGDLPRAAAESGAFDTEELYASISESEDLIPVEGIALGGLTEEEAENEEIIVYIDEPRTMTVRITPGNASNQDVNWEINRIGQRRLSVEKETDPETGASKLILNGLQEGPAKLTVYSADNPDVHGSYQIVVKYNPEKKPTELEITKRPDKLEYFSDEVLDLSGMEVQVHYSDGDTETVTDYTISAPSYSNAAVGEQIQVTVTYNKYISAAFYITIIAKPLEIEYITIAGHEDWTVRKGEQLDPKKKNGFTVQAVYGVNQAIIVDQASADNEDGYTLSDFDPELVGMQAVKVTYRGKSKVFGVRVTSDSDEESVLAAPVMNVKLQQGKKEVTLSHVNSNAEIFYTLDGSAPSRDSDSAAKYDRVIELKSTATVKAIAYVREGTAYKASMVSSGTFTVNAVSAPYVTVSGSDGAVTDGQMLEVGNILSFHCDTVGAGIYYTTDGTEPSEPSPENTSKKYLGAVLITPDMEGKDLQIKAKAVKDGASDSEVISLTCPVGTGTEGISNESAFLVMGDGDGGAGEYVPVAASIFTYSNIRIHEFSFTVEYDSDILELTSVSPANGMHAENLSVQENADKSGAVIKYDSDSAFLSSGEVCVLNFRAKNGAQIGKYPVSFVDTDVRNIVVDENERMLSMSYAGGCIILHHSDNAVKAEILFTGEDGATLTEEGIPQTGRISGSAVIERDETFDDFKTINAVLVLYSRSGMLANIKMWEVDVSDMDNLLFTKTIDIPDGIAISKVKMFVLSDEMVPVMLATGLGR